MASREALWAPEDASLYEHIPMLPVQQKGPSFSADTDPSVKLSRLYDDMRAALDSGDDALYIGAAANVDRIKQENPHITDL